MADVATARKSMSAQKGHLTRKGLLFEKRIAERDDVDVISMRRDLKDVFEKFHVAHEKYHDLLEDEDDTDASFEYYAKVQRSYTGYLQQINAYHPDENPDQHERLEPKVSDVTESIAKLMHLPPLELKPFDGSTQDFDTFIVTFKDVVESVVDNPATRLIRLKSLLTGIAANSIRSCRSQDANGYKTALNILYERFGNSYTVCNTIINCLKNGKMVYKPAELRTFADELANAEVTLKSYNMFTEIDTQHNIVSICHRLQPHLRLKWRDLVMKEKKKTSSYLDFSRFVTYVKDQADTINDPIYGEDALYDNVSNKSTFKTKPHVGLSTVSTSEQEQTPISQHAPQVCNLCKEDHRLYYCTQFNEMPVEKRIEYVKAEHLCMNCFRRGHRAMQCRSPYVCRIDGCNRKHSKLMHIPRTSDGGVASTSCATKSNTVTNIHMPMVPVIVNESFRTHALLDTGSSSSFCSRRLKDKLKLDGIKINYKLKTLHGSTSQWAEVVHIKISSDDNMQSLNMNNVLVIDDIPIVRSQISLEEYDHLSDLPISTSGQVDILIGQDFSSALVPLDVRRGRLGSPFATRTLFGWSINGKSESNTSVVSHRVIANFVSTSILDQKVNQLWEIEEDGMYAPHLGNSQEDNYVLKLWDEECKTVDGKYELPIPWKNPELNMPNNYEAAKSRLFSLRKSLERRCLTDAYDEGIKKMLANGYAESVSDDRTGESSSRCWYLPTHAVLKKEKEKIRIVYDCAHTYRNVSLNNSCLRGPNLTSKMFHVLIRFRRYKYAVMADVREMYNQISIPSKDRDSLRFLWISDGHIRTYRSTCHIFGGVWCSSSSSYALRKSTEATSNQRVKDVIESSFYVDDLAYSTSSIQEAHEVLPELKRTLSIGGFHLTKFVSTHQSILSPIDVSDRVGEPNMMSEATSNKALGVGWSRSDDVFFALSQVKLVHRKADMLSVLASVFDPLGLVGPLLIQGKLLFQTACRMKVDWQSPLPDTLENTWNEWARGLEDVNKLVIPRCLIPSNFDDASYELHMFCDASSLAYGCCVYIRCINKDGDINTSLICSKSRVCPIKSTTIPRLELQSAVLAAKLEHSVQTALNILLLPTTYWSDSMIAIAYIKNESRRFQVYVSNRVNTIRRLSDKNAWNHIPGDQNPADLLTRPTNIKKMDQSLWIRGPLFLRTHKSEWIKTPDPLIPDGDPECKKIATSNHINVEKASLMPLDALVTYYSDWSRLQRAVAWLQKISQLLLKKPVNDETSTFLDAHSLKRSKVTLIKHVQKQYYNQEINAIKCGNNISCSSRLRKLNPILDVDGCLIVGGRLRYSDLEPSAKTPYILPYDHPISNMIVKSVHDRCHLGREWIHSLVRRQYWIIRARNIIYQVSKNCVICKKLFARPGSQMMADLPKNRVQHNGNAFGHVGMDVFGPFIVKHGRHEVKRYGCIFTCFNVRAVHIEVLRNLESDTFLNALRRFVSRRGVPDTLFSDNATNFTGARAELFRSLKESRKKIQSYCTDHHITWNLNVPTASHMGGVYERMIRTIRKVLTGLLVESQRLTDDVLHTFLCEAESIINTRPLTKMSDDINDPTPLTPAHFLLIDVKPNVSPGHFSVGDMYRRRWRHTQYMCEVFWRRYVNVYLPELQRRQKWLHRKPNMKIGNLVLILDENTPRQLWPMGLVTEVIHGRDGIVRSVRIRTKAREFVRPITKVIDLELGT